jgi:aminoglycoside phosphotransferase family enzyme
VVAESLHAGGENRGEKELDLQSTETNTSAALVDKLLEPGFYDHPVEHVELVETHISWVFLAGEYAYKLKKPVDFGFLDFSSLAKRQHFCHEELRLNRRFAPQLYLDVVSIGGTWEAPEIGARPVLDYAVKMKSFPQDCQLDRMLAADRLTPEQLDRFAELIAGFHEQAPRAAQDSDYGSAAAAVEPALANFSAIRPRLENEDLKNRLAALESWTRTTAQGLHDDFRQRSQAGFVRECHGDLHLSNMAWFNDQPILFDCIEFSESLRWIDVINEVAFLIMDLDDREEPSLGWRFLNQYLAQTGDYAGLRLLDFYRVYRALVRAKVAALRLEQNGLSQRERANDLALLTSYLQLAETYSQKRQPLLLLTHGLSGSGKTWFVKQLAPLCRAVSLHSDRERKRLHRLATDADSRSAIAGGIYSAAAGRKTYDRLGQLAGGLIESGISALIDATFIRHNERERMRQLAHEHQVALIILDFPLAEDRLRQRLRKRAEEGERVSEANEEVLDYQLQRQEPLSPEEQELSLTITPETEAAAIARRIQESKSLEVP